MVPEWISFGLFLTLTHAKNIELLDCEPPHLPWRGGYGPVQEFYQPGDVVHYYCDVKTHIGGNWYRKCLDTGRWSGDTPVCDAPSTFSTVAQSSTTDDMGIAENAIDDDLRTCTSTRGGQREEWTGTFTKPGQLTRVMTFLPKGEVSYEVVLIKSNGAEVVCASHTERIDQYDWVFHNCPEPNNQDASGLKIRSLTTDPLQICEIRATVLTSPKCVDPHMIIDSGRLRLDRHSAVLVCNEGFKRSPDKSLQCVREGVWNRKSLYCYGE